MKENKIIAVFFSILIFSFLGVFSEGVSAEPAEKIKLTFMTPWRPSSAWSPFWSAQKRYWHGRERGI